jgi:hypothetical protein
MLKKNFWKRSVQRFFSRYSFLALAGAGIIFISSPSEARELQGRFGLGYNAEFANNAPLNSSAAISVKYGFTRDLAIEAVLGAVTSSPKYSVYGAKFFKNIFLESNLNFYFMAGGAFVSTAGQNGAQFLGGFGTEFFIPGLESLGFSMETGASFDNLSGNYALRTLGVSFLNAGMHFYF